MLGICWISFWSVVCQPWNKVGLSEISNLSLEFVEALNGNLYWELV